MYRVGAQVSRESPPPLPGGYAVGEQVYFTGTGETFEDGDRLEHGKQGEVVGPATSESHRGKGVAVLFSGNKSATNCRLTAVRRRRRRAATHSSPRRPIAAPPISSSHATSGRTGKLRAATAAAGRLHGRRAGLLHGGG